MQAIEYVQMIGACLVPYAGAMLGVVLPSGKPEKDDWYKKINKPVWTPRGYVFPIVWTTLYIAMGYASYLVWEECRGFTNMAVIPLTLYAIQLLLNWTWTPLFFGAHQIGAAAIEIVIFGVFVAATMIAFFQVSRLAGALFIPYLIWACFATALNITIWLLNRDNTLSDHKDL